MYIGGYGPHGLELIQLQRGYGRWDEDAASPSTSASQGTDFYEYVEGVKVTGDPNVPAGKVTFRAKVGPKYKLPPIEYANVDLGTVSRLWLPGGEVQFVSVTLFWQIDEVHLLGNSSWLLKRWCSVCRSRA